MSFTVASTYLWPIFIIEVVVVIVKVVVELLRAQQALPFSLSVCWVSGWWDGTWSWALSNQKPSFQNSLTIPGTQLLEWNFFVRNSLWVCQSRSRWQETGPGWSLLNPHRRKVTSTALWPIKNIFLNVYMEKKSSTAPRHQEDKSWGLNTFCLITVDQSV